MQMENEENVHRRRYARKKYTVEISGNNNELADYLSVEILIHIVEVVFFCLLLLLSRFFFFFLNSSNGKHTRIYNTSYITFYLFIHFSPLHFEKFMLNKFKSFRHHQLKDLQLVLFIACRIQKFQKYQT